MRKRGLALGLFLMMSLQAMPDQWQEVAERFYQRECASRYDYLAYWSPKEEFPSLGIAHFIWVPQGVKVPFEELFPSVLIYLQAHEVKLPLWLDPHASCPWTTREEFYRDDVRLEELRKLLWQTRELQVSFIAERFSLTLEELKKTQAETCRPIEELSKTQKGFYAMLDYSHFKGTGLHVKERYDGYGWGLLQVLQLMDQKGRYDLSCFVACAQQVLQRRVQHAPKERNEERFLDGWLKRLQGYL